MADHAAKLAEFLVEHSRSIRSNDLVGVIADMFPEITEEEFARGFAIAEEAVIGDINAAIASHGSSDEMQSLLQQYLFFKDGKKA